jgi:hypothetical protein
MEEAAIKPASNGTLHQADIPTIGIIVIGITSTPRVSKVGTTKELGPTVAAFNFCGRWDFELNDPEADSADPAEQSLRTNRKWFV